MELKVGSLIRRKISKHRHSPVGDIAIVVEINGRNQVTYSLLRDNFNRRFVGFIESRVNPFLEFWEVVS